MDGDWKCTNCNSAECVTLRVRSDTCAYYLFCDGCALVVEEDVDMSSGTKPREGWTSLLSKLIGPPQAEPEPAEPEECYCFCHDNIIRYQCYYCECVPARDHLSMYFMSGK